MNNRSMREKVIEKEMYNYGMDLVSSYAKWDGDGYYLDWNRIPEDEQGEFIAIMTDLDGKDFSPICENEESFRDDILAKIVLMLKRDDMEAKLDFAECVKKATRKYFEERAIEYLDDLTNEYTHEELADRGLCLRQDRDHGDFVVCRI